ncbi:conserved membrane hypothetical protein [Tenacibaculum litopenaei]|uniref:helix-turn-helix domain-containing protein n=1 Tax=Tenacibaculum litopenaei TaxID=396016 RepID=UPI0038962B86
MYTYTFEKISAIFYLLTAFSAAMLGFLFLTHRLKAHKANVFLVVFIWSLAYSLLNEFLADEEVVELIGEKFFSFNSFLFIVPSLFLYIVSHSNKNEIKYWIWLYAPGVLVNIIPFQDPELAEVFNGLLYMLISFPLMVLSMRYIKKYRKDLQSFYSTIDNRTLHWIRVLMLMVISLHVFMFVVELIIDENSALDAIMDFIESLVTFSIVYWVGVKGFQQYELDTPNTNAVEPPIIEVEKKCVEENCSLEVEEDNLDTELHNKFECLCTLIEEHKIYTNPNLTIKSLSEQLTVRERELSNLINNCTKKNFHQFINQFRVLEFKRLIASDKAVQYSILGLARDAGFSSKSTFYKVFKELEGLTPSEYKNRINSPNTRSGTP